MLAFVLCRRLACTCTASFHVLTRIKDVIYRNLLVRLVMLAGSGREDREVGGRGRGCESMGGTSVWWLCMREVTGLSNINKSTHVELRLTLNAQEFFCNTLPKLFFSGSVKYTRSDNVTADSAVICLSWEIKKTQNHEASFQNQSLEFCGV